MKKSLLWASLLLTTQTLFGAGSLATVKYGLTSLDNDGGFDLSKHSFRIDGMAEVGYPIKPRLGLAYINIDESKAKGGVSGALQLDIEGVYEIESRYVLTPYLLGGLGYEYVMDSRPNFDSQFYFDGGIGLRYPMQGGLNIVGEFKGIRMLSSNDQDGEFAFYLGVGMPFGTVRRPADIDQDGVYDYADMCPNSPMGSQVGVDGCPLKQVQSYIDSDGDTIPDGVDICPNTPQGVGVNERGCPVRATVQAAPLNTIEPSVLAETTTSKAILGDMVMDKEVKTIPKPKKTFSKDKDHDGVEDSIDQCPHTPKGFSVNSIGCALKRDLNVKFDPSSSRISASSKVNIGEFARFVKRYPNAKVRVVGYTDTSGNRASNKRLSQKRAQIVKNLLIKYGVPAAKITAIGKGELNPIATNETAEGREKNRRIEVEIR